VQQQTTKEGKGAKIASCQKGMLQLTRAGKELVVKVSTTTSRGSRSKNGGSLCLRTEGQLGRKLERRITGSQAPAIMSRKVLNEGADAIRRVERAFEMKAAWCFVTTKKLLVKSLDRGNQRPGVMSRVDVCTRDSGKAKKRTISSERGA